MKFLVVLCALFAVALCDELTHKFDNFDIDKVLSNDRLLENYYKCLMEGTGCTPEGEELRKVLNDVIDNECAKCTDKQKGAAKKIGKFLYENKREMWENLVAKYDPDNKHRATWEKNIKEGQ